MPLQSGNRLGPYQIDSLVGAGGMGEVYRATDTNLDRAVAIKVLPESFASDADRVARFTREAKTLAALNHPNIAAIYGLEKTKDLTALVMELVEGEDLSAHIAGGPIAPPDALPIAKQIADALEAAHEQGIIHRDLKPQNIKLRADGTVKVLDFGLAKALAPDGAGASADAMNSPTLTGRMTQLGMIIGTAAYMSPEQAKGRAVDRRADIWAFGVVLYEMLSGRRAFDGEDISETLAAVLTREPDFGALPASTPPAFKTLMRRCLERDPKKRLRDIGEARIALSAINETGASGMSDATDTSTTAAPGAVLAAPAAVASRRVAIWRALAIVLALALVAVAVQWRRSAHTGAGPVAKSAILLPPDVTFDTSIFTVIAMSRDGSKVALIGSSGGVRRLYVRRLGDFDPQLIAGTDDASSPFFSPTGTSIGFFAGGKLNKVSADGGPVIPLAEAQDNRGGVWADDDTIIFAPVAAGPLFRVPANGGPTTPFSTIDEKAQERTHRWPVMLPDGKTLLITVGSVAYPDDYNDARIETIRLDTGERRVVVEGGHTARYAATGHLLFLKGKILFAVTFDPATGVAGTERIPVIDGVSGDVTTGAANYAVAESGAIVYVPGDAGGGERKLAWVDLKGSITAIDVPAALYSDPAVRPDGRYVAIAINAGGGTRDVHVIDTVRGTPSRLTSGGENRTPRWIDDRRLLYATYDRVRNVTKVVSQLADGTDTPEVLAEIPGGVYIDDIASDGSTALLSVNPQVAGKYVHVAKLAIRKGATPEIVASAASADVTGSSLSPDRQWVAYGSNQSGRYDVYVQSFVTGGSRVKVSTVGGNEPRWARDGHTLFYTQADSLMAVALEPGAGFSPGKPVRLAGGVTPTITDSGYTYSLSPKEDRLLMLRFVRDNIGPPEARLVLNWFDELRAKALGR
jgi:serine/threonine-protein kinase